MVYVSLNFVYLISKSNIAKEDIMNTEGKKVSMECSIGLTIELKWKRKDLNL
jgi:hypothetical protein